MSDIKLAAERKTDKDVADELRSKIIEKMTPVLEVLNEATQQGFEVSMNFGPDWGPQHKGKCIINTLKISKVF